MLEFVQPTLTAIGSALTIIKQGKSLSTDSTETKLLKQELETIRSQLEKSDAQIAHALDYELCKCTYPPQIMLFKKDENADVCPNCGHSEDRPGGMSVSLI